MFVTFLVRQFFQPPYTEPAALLLRSKCSIFHIKYFKNSYISKASKGTCVEYRVKSSLLGAHILSSTHITCFCRELKKKFFDKAFLFGGLLVMMVIVYLRGLDKQNFSG